MARGIVIVANRRTSGRVTPQLAGWPRVARLRPARSVLIVNLSAGGALVESTVALQPGVRTELQPLGGMLPTRGGCIGRCRVIDIDPMRYEAAVVFDQPLAEWGSE